MASQEKGHFSWLLVTGHKSLRQRGVVRAMEKRDFIWGDYLEVPGGGWAQGTWKEWKRFRWLKRTTEARLGAMQ